MGKRISLETKKKLLIHKRYFDCGRGLIQYGEWLIAYFGLTTGSTGYTMLFAAGYAFLCYFLGWIYYHTDFLTADTEISNSYNPFVAEMRAVIKKPIRRKL